MGIVKELKGADLIFTAKTMLMGEENVDFCYYRGDALFWRDRLYMSRN
ncbi:hypothetical protein ES708_27394 [subsurface metagenome]